MSALKFGILSYINCLPATLALELGEVGGDLSLVRGTPAELNQAIRGRELDVSVVSAAEYLENPELYHRLEEFSLWCDGAVQSVLLFSALSKSELLAQPVRIAVTPESATSVALVRLLIPNAETTPFQCLEHAERLLSEEAARGTLLIGDTALAPPRWVNGLHCYDLGQWWKDQTGLPMSYAVWVARRDLEPEKLAQAKETLQQSCSWGEENSTRVVEQACRRSGLPKARLEDYYRRLNFRVTPESAQGYQMFKDQVLIDLSQESQHVASHRNS